MRIASDDPVGAAVLSEGINQLIKDGSLKIPGIDPGQEVKIVCPQTKKVKKG